MSDLLEALAWGVFDQAIDRDGADRFNYLANACATVPGLRARVEALLAAAERQDGFLAEPTLGLAKFPDDTVAGEQPGTWIGPYRLIEQIGEGGFGSVFRAEQSAPVRRQVALKIIKLGMDTRQVIVRFEAERQALALMEHPNIARIYDAGATEIGRPYFAMELVDGQPVTRYCDDVRLSIAQRLELFREICGAVQHAHQKGVIHRDLKPTNVLATTQDNCPFCKIIDFGIAKATTGRLTDRTLTELHQFIGTPEYMSPEQVAGLDIDTRSDIYALGILLYELLTGTTPFDRQRLAGSGFDGMRKIIRDEEPLRPSAWLSAARWESGTLESRKTEQRADAPSSTIASHLPTFPPSDSSLAEIAMHRGATPVALLRALRGDLDWIVLKCLEKDRTRRYETASALADDVDRYLNHEPVLATPPSQTYRLRKFVERNRVMVAAALAIAAVLVLGVIGTTVGLLRAMHEEAQTRQQKFLAEQNAAKAVTEAGRANREMVQSRAITEFMREVLTSADSDKSGADVRLVEVLDDASSSASQRFAEYPLQEAQVRDLLGQVYYNLGLFPQAKQEYQRAAVLLRANVGEDDPRTLAAESSTVGVAIDLSQTREAEKALPSLLEKMNRVFGPDDLRTLHARRSLAIVECNLGRLDHAERILLELRSHPRLVDNNSVQVHLLHNLLLIPDRRGSAAGPAQWRSFVAECEPLALEMYERALREYGADARITLRAQIRVAMAAWGRADFGAAVEICRTLLDRTSQRLVECHSIRTDATATLAMALAYAGKHEEAAENHIKYRECVRAASKHDPITFLATLCDGLHYLERAKRAQEGEAQAREFIALLQKYPGGLGGMMFMGEMYLGAFLSMQQRLEEADDIFRSLVARETIADRALRARMHLRVGAHRTRGGRFQEAEHELLEAVELVEDIRSGTFDLYPDDLILEFITLYDAWGHAHKAHEYRGLLAEIDRK